MKAIARLATVYLLSSMAYAEWQYSSEIDLCHFFRTNIWLSDVTIDGSNFVANARYDHENGMPELYYQVKEFVKDSNVSKVYVFEQTFPLDFIEFECVAEKKEHLAILKATAKWSSGIFELEGTIGRAHQDPSKYLYRLYNKTHTVNIFGLADKDK